MINEKWSAIELIMQLNVSCNHILNKLRWKSIFKDRWRPWTIWSNLGILVFYCDTYFELYVCKVMPTKLYIIILKMVLIVLITCCWCLQMLTDSHKIIGWRRERGRYNQYIFGSISRLQNALLDCRLWHTGKPIHTEHWKVLISCKSHFLWTSYLMFWHCYPCKCSAQCLWILRALFCTWIVRVVRDHLILRRWWLTHAFISGYAPLWCQKREGDQKRKRER